MKGARLEGGGKWMNGPKSIFGGEPDARSSNKDQNKGRTVVKLAQKETFRERMWALMGDGSGSGDGEAPMERPFYVSNQFFYLAVASCGYMWGRGKKTLLTHMAQADNLTSSKAGWPNGKALDYESRDCRFDPCVGQFLVFTLSHCVHDPFFICGGEYGTEIRST
ncbi:hypothetical protein N7532_002598 [Penicillium argentinense]|uniref:Uncharacterized protein n=1 Tax=Penicillium argentinense TaxID=1131581 RepID=A0A9W9G0Z5_9EURO|nr:uncharacterized protein N7532_002598 [Penicillium argentinense]KAJ5109953.1 hypothetical protein N7532_002598 [Penicillium argentinense]